MPWSRDNFQDLVFFLSCGPGRIKFRVVRLGGRCLLLLGHLYSPQEVYFEDEAVYDYKIPKADFKKSKLICINFHFQGRQDRVAGCFYNVICS